jgi:hypothetical protein
MNVDEIVQEHTIDDQNNETESDKQEITGLKEGIVQEKPERQGNSGTGTGNQDNSGTRTGSQDKSGTGTESQDNSGTGTESQDKSDAGTESQDIKTIGIIKGENTGTSDGTETKDEVSTTDGEKMEINVMDDEEGEQIVVGKQRISDVVSEPVVLTGRIIRKQLNFYKTFIFVKKKHNYMNGQ